MTLPAYLDTKFCDLLCGWENLERKLQQVERANIVDFNLPEYETKRSFQSRQQVLNELNAILSDPNAQTDRIFYQRVFGLRAYLVDEMNGKSTPFNELMVATMGLELTYIPDEEVADLRQKAIEACQAAGIDFNNFVEEAAEKSRVIAVKDIPEWFRARHPEALKHRDGLFPSAPELPVPQVRVFQSELMTRARIFGFGNSMIVEFNETRVKDESETGLLHTNNHEILGHGVQVSFWEEKIRAGRMPRHQGLTCMQGFESFQMEALAQYAPIYFAPEEDPLYNAHVWVELHGKQAVNNFLYMLHDGASDEELIAYHCTQMPYRDEKFARERINHGNLNSLRRVYTPVYSPGIRMFSHIMETLPQSNRMKFLKAAYETYMDPTDMYKLGLGLGAAPLKHFSPKRPQQVEAVARKLELSATHPAFDM